MASLLDDEDFAEIRSAIKDVTDTFGQADCTYRRFERTNSPMPESDDTLGNYTDIALKTLRIFEKEDEDSQTDRTRQGSIDFAEGYFLFNYEDLDAAGLITDKEFNGDPTKDRIAFNGVEHEIIGSPALGQLKDIDSVVRVMFKKLLVDGS